MSVRQLVTADELQHLPNPLDRRRELVDGEVVEASPTTMLHGIIVARLTRRIDEFVQDHELGVVAAGTRQVWVLWPERQSVTVHNVDHTRELGPDTQLAGGDVLPGFSICVGDLFEIRRQR